MNNFKGVRSFCHLKSVILLKPSLNSIHVYTSSLFIRYIIMFLICVPCIVCIVVSSATNSGWSQGALHYLAPRRNVPDRGYEMPWLRNRVSPIRYVNYSACRNICFHYICIHSIIVSQYFKLTIVLLKCYNRISNCAVSSVTTSLHYFLITFVCGGTFANVHG